MEDKIRVINKYTSEIVIVRKAVIYTDNTLATCGRSEMMSDFSNFSNFPNE